jgi:hypothetical protein
MPDLGTAGSVVGIANGVKGLFGGSKTSNAAGGASDAAIIAAQTQAEVAAKNEARNDEMWARFKEKYWPLEDELLDPEFRNVQDRSEEMAAQAGDAVTTSFGAQRGQSQRALERAGVNPMDGRFRAVNRTLDLGEAATKAAAMNDARATERRRVEDTNFSRALQVMSLGRGIPAQVSGGSNQAAATYGSNANIYSNLARMLAQDAGSAGAGGMQAVLRGIEGLTSGGGGNSTFGFGAMPALSVAAGGLGTNAFSEQSNMLAAQQFEEGGPVRGPSHEEGGRIIEAEGGEYVLSREVVEDLGLDRIEKMVADAKERAKARAAARRSAKGAA